MPIIIADDSVIENPQFPPIFVPFNVIDGCLAFWRGDFSEDLTGNGHTLTKVGTPTQARLGVSCNKNSGYLTNVPDGINRTLICIHRQPSVLPAPDQTYSYPFGNVSQRDTLTGVGIGAIQASAASVNANNVTAVVGAAEKTNTLFAKASAASKPAATATQWQWTAFIVDGDNNFAALYIPQQKDEFVMAQLTPGVQLKNRWVTNMDGSPAYYRVGAWRDPSTPLVASASTEVAMAAVFDRPHLISNLRQQYLNDKFWMGQFGYVI